MSSVLGNVIASPVNLDAVGDKEVAEEEAGWPRLLNYGRKVAANVNLREEAGSR